MSEIIDQASILKKIITDKVEAVTESRPKETRGTLYGIGYGAFAGFIIGGGVTIGSAVALPLVAVAAVTGGIIGNRAGIGKDKQTLQNEMDQYADFDDDASSDA
jgi:uncharacterized protein YcfJ